MRRLMALAVIWGALTGLNSSPAVALPYLRRVNVPYVNGNIPMALAGVFWLGRVTPSDNYADVRMAYNDTESVCTCGSHGSPSVV